MTVALFVVGKKSKTQLAQGGTVTSLLFHARGKLPVTPATGQGLNGCYFYIHRNKYYMRPETLVELFNWNKPSSHHQINNNTINNGAITGRSYIDLLNILINTMFSPTSDRATMSMKRSIALAATWLVSSDCIHNIRLVRGRYSPANLLTFTQTLHLQ